MALISTTIETLSTTAVAESIALTDFLQPKINDNDREVSWDGFIYIYHDKACSKDKLKGRLAVQVKGKECKNLSRKEISYPMETSDLRNYLSDGGIILFVVLLAEEGTKKKIYYCELTPVKLRIILKQAKKQQTKSIKLTPFPSNKEKKASIVFNCFENCRKQHSYSDAVLPSLQELQTKGILESISIPVTTLPGQDPQTVLLNNEVYAYAKIKGSAILQPLEMIPTHKHTSERENVSVSINGRQFYSFVTVIRSADEVKYQLGSSFSFTVGNKKGESKLKYENSPYARVLATDLDFMLSYIEHGSFEFDNITIPFDRAGADFSNFDMEEQKKRLKSIQDIVKVLDLLNCKEDLNVIELSDLDLRTLERIVNAMLYNAPVRGLKEGAPLVVKMAVGPLKFSVCLKKHPTEKGAYELTDFFQTELDVAYENKHGEKVPCSQFIILSPDDLAALNNIRYDVILPSFQHFELTDESATRANYFTLGLIEAYDKSKKKELLSLAFDFANWLKEFPEEFLPNDIRTLNYLQIIKRQRAFTKEETKQIYTIISSNNSSDEILVGAYLLLDQQEAAEMYFEKLEEEQQINFTTYPIYHFWKKDEDK